MWLDNYLIIPLLIMLMIPNDGSHATLSQCTHCGNDDIFLLITMLTCCINHIVDIICCYWFCFWWIERGELFVLVLLERVKEYVVLVLLQDKVEFTVLLLCGNKPIFIIIYYNTQMILWWSIVSIQSMRSWLLLRPVLF